MTVEVGQVPPDLDLMYGRDRERITLSQFRGKQPVVLAFFPLAFTGG